MTHSIAPVTAEASTSGRRRVGSFVAGIIAAVFALILLGSGIWALWVDRIDRGSGGFVSVGTSELSTPTFAIQSPLTGDGPDWLYGSTVFGTGRVRATSHNDRPLFIGIARHDDVVRYLLGTGYATIQHLASDELTTHEGGAPAVPPTSLTIWAASTQGTGQQTLLWKPRGGDWSIVLMNADASPGVSLRGDLGAKFPLLPWVALGLLVFGVALALLGRWLLVRGRRPRHASVQPIVEPSQPTSTDVPVAAHDQEQVNA